MPISLALPNTLLARITLPFLQLFTHSQGERNTPHLSYYIQFSEFCQRDKENSSRRQKYYPKDLKQRKFIGSNFYHCRSAVLMILLFVWVTAVLFPVCQVNKKIRERDMNRPTQQIMNCQCISCIVMTLFIKKWLYSALCGLYYLIHNHFRIPKLSTNRINPTAIRYDDSPIYWISPQFLAFLSGYIVNLIMKSNSYEEVVKYILVGDSNVGKTSIIRSFCDRKFNEREKNTVGLDYGQRVLNISGKEVLIQLWDTAGQERFRTLTPSFYRSAMGVLLVYSVTDKNSFNSIEIWMKQIQQYAVENVPVLILSNKADVKEKQVSEQQSRALSEHYHIDLLMTSAKQNKNIEAAMIRLYNLIEKEKKAISNVSSITHTIKLMAVEQKHGCRC